MLKPKRIMRHTILLCEDDRDIVEMTTKYLTRKGHFVSSVNNCEAIWEAIEVKRPDIILMDLSIPRMGGAEATQRLKESVRTRDIKVYLLSAFPGIVEIAKDVEADGYLEKPFDINDLNKLVGGTEQ